MLGLWILLSLPTLGLLQHKPPTATGSHQEGEEADPASIISCPISEISHQQPLHRFHSKSFTPTLKSGHCVCKIGGRSLLMTRRGCLGHCIPPLPFHSHTFVIPLNVTRLFFFLSLTKQQRKKYYRKLCNGKGFCKIHNSKPQFFFFPHCAPALCNRPLFVTDFKENVCSSKISRFLVNCQKDFFFFIASGKIQKE